MQPLLLILVLLLVAGSAHGQTLYKSIGPDGKVVYGDRPPVAGKVEKTLQAQDLPNTAIPEKTLLELETLRKKVKVGALPTTGVVLFSATWCGFCRKAKAYLAQRGTSYQEKDIDTPEGKLAYIQAGGRGGVPMLVAGGTVVRGFKEEAYASVLPKTK